MADLKKEIENRRTFAIISHPDAGKTTITEKFLLYGGAIQEAGMVKGKKNSRHAVSDWMEIEKQRGISVTSSVLQFRYEGKCINILDTPGHQDFSEDTYRTLMAADAAVMVIDASKGVEAQTRKLFKVCAMRGVPIFTFINKMDREARDPYELLEDIENELGIGTYAVNWPIGSGKRFKGVYDRMDDEVIAFEGADFRHEVKAQRLSIDDPILEGLLPEDQYQTLIDDVELLSGAGDEFDLKAVHEGRLSPVFFGSALTNFGVEPFLKKFLQMTPPPTARTADIGVIDPFDPHFSAFVFKIQANMNKAHRDRVAFMRICSGKFERGQEVLHVQSGKKMSLAAPQQLMAQDRSIVDEAYAGDIIGIFDPGVFSIGDTVCDPKHKCVFSGIPTFAPELFAVVRQKDTLKRKQFVKGVEQIAQEGAIQIFREPNAGMESVIVGVVGVLQFEVLEYRLKNEYNVEIIRENLPYEHVRWVENDEEDFDVKRLQLTSDTKIVEDLKGNTLLLFTSPWNITYATDHNEGLRLGTFVRLVFCAVRTQLVGETSVSRQLSGCFFVQRDKLGAGVVVRKDLAVVRAVFGHVFRAVLRQTDAVAVADGVEGERVISGRDREIGRAQSEQLAHRRTLDRDAAELYGFDAAGVRADRGLEPGGGRAGKVGGREGGAGLFAEFVR